MALLIGIVIGLVLGLTGAGGSIFAVPLLVMLLNLSLPEAIGLSLGAVAISSLFGVIARIKSKDIKWLPAVVFASVGSMFAPIGVLLNQSLSAGLVISLFAILTLTIASRMWQQTKDKPSEAAIVRADNSKTTGRTAPICVLNRHKPFQIKPRCLIGLSIAAATTGVLSGLFGVGGGFIVVPALIALIAISTKEAVATSLAIIMLISSIGFISFTLSEPMLPLSTLLQTSFGGIIGMLLGTLLCRYVAGIRLQQIFAISMVVTTGLLAFKHFSSYWS